MNEITKALEALDRIFNYCEEIDLHIPKEEQTGYKMNDDVAIIREALFESQKIGHWIRWYDEVEHKTYTEIIPHCKCSECNKEYSPHTSLFIKYCSQCGAKMIDLKKSEV